MTATLDRLPAGPLTHTALRDLALCGPRTSLEAKS